MGVTLGGGVFSDLSAVVRFLWWGFVTLVSSTNSESSFYAYVDCVVFCFEERVK